MTSLVTTLYEEEPRVRQSSNLLCMHCLLSKLWIFGDVTLSLPLSDIHGKVSLCLPCRHSIAALLNYLLYNRIAYIVNFQRIELIIYSCHYEAKRFMPGGTFWVVLSKRQVRTLSIELGGAGFNIARTTTNASVCLCERKTS